MLLGGNNTVKSAIEPTIQTRKERREEKIYRLTDVVKERETDVCFLIIRTDTKQRTRSNEKGVCDIRGLVEVQKKNWNHRNKLEVG